MKRIVLAAVSGFAALILASWIVLSSSGNDRVLAHEGSAVLAPLGLVAAQAVQVDPALTAYQRTSGVSGNLNSVGSDTLNNVMTQWQEAFQKYYPNVKIQVEGKGSGTAPPALRSGTAQIGPMSRAMNAKEIDDFEGKFQYPPTQIRVAIDALAVWVNKDSPLDQITQPQIDAIFSKARNGGYSKDIQTWGDLGVTAADWVKRPISLYGRNSASGTYGYFKEHALYKGDFKDTVKEQPGSAAVVQGITEDLYGMGYSGIGYRTSGVKPLKIAAKEGEPFQSTDPEIVYSGKYPLSRHLFLYVNKAPKKELEPLVREFIRFTLSREGQEVVVKDGYLPLRAAVAAQEQAKLEANKP